MMKIDQIDTMSQFSVYVQALSKNLEYKGNLRQFLTALLSLIDAYADENPTWKLLTKLIVDALKTSLSDISTDTGKHLNPPDLEEPQSIEKDLEILRDMISYQIADLQRMADSGTLNNPHRYFGIDSPTGHRWYNFEVATFLECASRAGSDGSKSSTDNVKEIPCSWFDLAVFLWLGQIYE